jgi:hypothetical protein
VATSDRARQLGPGAETARHVREVFVEAASPVPVSSGERAAHAATAKARTTRRRRTVEQLVMLIDSKRHAPSHANDYAWRIKDVDTSMIAITLAWARSVAARVHTQLQEP